MNIPHSLPPPVDNSTLLPEQFNRVVELVTAIANQLPKKPEAKYLTVQEAAEYCRVAVQTIYNNRRYIARMPGIGKLLFTRQALDEWLATRKTRVKRK